VLAFATLAGAAFVACKTEPVPEPEPTPDSESCSVSSDCVFGEIDHEIRRGTDCLCLYGCPYLPLNRASIERRQSQYDELCNPGEDGNGNSCGNR